VHAEPETRSLRGQVVREVGVRRGAHRAVHDPVAAVDRQRALDLELVDAESVAATDLDLVADAVPDAEPEPDAGGADRGHRDRLEERQPRDAAVALEA